jgi:hypothetical protein
VGAPHGDQGPVLDGRPPTEATGGQRIPAPEPTVSLDSKPSEIFYGLALRAMRTEVLKEVLELIEGQPPIVVTSIYTEPRWLDREALVKDLETLRGGE